MIRSNKRQSVSWYTKALWLSAAPAICIIGYLSLVGITTFTPTTWIIVGVQFIYASIIASMFIAFLTLCNIPHKHAVRDMSYRVDLLSVLIYFVLAGTGAWWLWGKVPFTTIGMVVGATGIFAGIIHSVKAISRNKQTYA